uniref:E3 ubiquitin-protein ligase TRIM71-like n=1 Tax=Saccoglossus kowalevskii TaxID=10224 RepID=A0ABM0MVJ8_SACKO|nr:PREDICTED: E3 ubiquitin-protein ligase TRIM71-like [Saccoglossus kowalevskii]
MFSTKQSVCVSQCTFGKSVEYLAKGQSVDLPIFTKDCMGRHIVSEHEVKAIHIKPDGSQKQMEVTDNDDGTYYVTLLGDIQGKHEIRVMIGDAPIPGQPFTVEVVKGLVRTIGQKGDGESQFNSICGIAINKNGDIVAADKDNNRLQIIDITGKCKKIILLERHFKPIDVAVLNDNTYMVIGDRRSSGIVVVNQNKNTVSFFGKNELEQAKSITICPVTGLVYVLNKNINVFVKVFTQECEFVKSMKLKRSTPSCIRLDSRGLLYVCVARDVEVYDRDGVFLYTISYSSKPVQLNYPKCLAFDKYGYLYIASEQEVRKYGCKGRFVYLVHTHANEMNEPTGIAVLHDLTVVAAYNKNNCIKLFVE